MSTVTILTAPVLFRPLAAVLQLLRNIKYAHTYSVASPKYTGHYAVTRSLVEGLQKINVFAQYNPDCLNKLAPAVVVLSSLAALRQAIFLKRIGIIKYLIAGPNLVNLPSDNLRLITAPEIDIFIQPSEWTKQLYLWDAPVLKNKLRVWPAGVDTEFWKPQQTKSGKAHILLYYKRPQLELFESCAKYLKQNGYAYSIIYWGKYSLEEYQQALQKSTCLIHFVEQESQGISLAEAWSMDVPTLVWNPKNWFTKGNNHLASSAPYLTKYTGQFFHDFESLKTIIEKKRAFNDPQYSPREWVVQNLSDEVCAKKMLTIINKVNH